MRRVLSSEEIFTTLEIDFHKTHELLIISLIDSRGVFNNTFANHGVLLQRICLCTSCVTVCEVHFGYPSTAITRYFTIFFVFVLHIRLIQLLI